jgi:3-hydroxyisobutyrate dehydrogenase-like beta-hydroxyacid dehydrogenase
MSSISRIGMLGLGEVGVRLVEDLLQHSQAEILVWDKQFDDPNSKPIAHLQTFVNNPRVVAVDAAAQLGQANLVLSAVTAQQAIDAANSVLPGLHHNTWFVDFNSVSPTTKQTMAESVTQQSGRFVEAAIMSPIDPKRIASPILLAGPHAQTFLEIGADLGFVGMTFCSSDYGKAAATKMCRSVMIKGMEALVTESMLAAKYYGVEDAVLTSLNNLFPRPDWPDHARYLISRSVLHGVRRAEEMREVTETVRDAGIEPWMSAACVERQDWAPQFNSALNEKELTVMLTSIRQQIESQGVTPC